MEQRKTPKRGFKNKVLMLIDFENLIINARKEIPSERFSIEAGFNRIIKKITEEVGEIVGVFAFLPPDRAMVWGKDLKTRLSFPITIVNCPLSKDKDKEGKEDTTDSELIELGGLLAKEMGELTHICIGSGDRDFNDFRKKVALKGLKRITVAADLKSLSSEAIKLTDTNPSTGRKMVYLFSPTED